MCEQHFFGVVIWLENQNLGQNLAPSSQKIIANNDLYDSQQNQKI